ncbi:hypothetical protein BX600DRAFT_495072 [Xylariales sp. PMI_506]|nr:hypothetical protein BX600DRAFT_495072 [Xylariales sp. PMI_506]
MATGSFSAAEAAEAATMTTQEAALALVQPLQPILAGFNHRNKNQHRGSRWWGSFGMLRRNLEKLAAELLEDQRRAHARAGKKRKRTEGDQQQREHAPPPSAQRAAWMRDVLVPGCYVAFSQLSADNQFATLGIVLMGVLAQIQAACVLMVGEAEVKAAATVTSAAMTMTAKLPAMPAREFTTSQTVKEALGSGDVTGEFLDDDAGQAVSREELAATKANVSQPSTSPPVKRKKKDNINQDAPTRGPSGGATTAAFPEKESTGKKKLKEDKGKNDKKKKKKSKKGDEFDSLFSSLF